MSEQHFYACTPCYETHAGYRPTVINGAAYRPVAYHRYQYGRCALCGQERSTPHKYTTKPDEVDEW